VPRLWTNNGVSTLLTALAQVGVITTRVADAIKALAVRPDPVAELDVRRALFADDGTLLV